MNKNEQSKSPNSVRTDRITPPTAIWQLGFRPFFLLAAIYAVVAVLLWLLVFFQIIPAPRSFEPVTWHAHEMVYGFATAVIAGFVLTASQNWTGKRGLHGAPLIFLVLLWLSARIALFVSSGPNYLASALDLGFYPCLGFFLFPYLRDPELKAERVFFAFFLFYFGGNLVTHLEALGVLHGIGRRGIYLGLYTTLVMIVFIGGRVIPFFTESSLARRQPKELRSVEVLSHLSIWAFLLTSILSLPPWLNAGIAFTAALTHLIRLQGWYVRRIRRIPLIWILHTSYLWIIVGLFLSGLSYLDFVAMSASIHAFAIGGIGAIIYGMMSRVALGHTGRRLHPKFMIVVGYYCLNAAALVRVAGALIPTVYPWALKCSGALWALAFLIFVWVYLPMLIQPRVDGEPG